MNQMKFPFIVVKTKHGVVSSVDGFVSSVDGFETLEEAGAAIEHYYTLAPDLVYDPKTDDIRVYKLTDEGSTGGIYVYDPAKGLVPKYTKVVADKKPDKKPFKKRGRPKKTTI